MGGSYRLNEIGQNSHILRRMHMWREFRPAGLWEIATVAHALNPCSKHWHSLVFTFGVE